MNTLKRIYVMLYIIGAVVLVQTGASGLIAGYYPFASIGVLLTAAPIVVVLSLALITQKVARTSANFPIALSLGFVGVLLAIGEVYLANGDRELMMLAIIGFVGFLLYVFWYSRFGRTPSPEIAIGSILPSFEVSDVDGNNISSETLTETPSVIIFIRGNWCPLCMGQVNEMSAGMSGFVEAGVRVVIIAPQSLAKTKTLAKGRPDGMAFYSDTGNAAARLLKIHNPAGLPLGMEVFGYRSESVLPTVIATAKGGEILWTHETDNYRVRPKTDDLLAVFAGG
jgi:peroxiredoxin